MNRDVVPGSESQLAGLPVVRVRAAVRGQVQGVGFRPFAYRLAREMGLSGHVANSPQGADLEVQGPEHQVEGYLLRIASDLPQPGHVAGMQTHRIPVTAECGFSIRESVDEGRRSASILPDIGTCDECLRELFDPGDRRYRYPFVNCTHCGPRYTIVRALPYDRPNTSMAGFTMCSRCAAEYRDPMDRRYHAQPIACPTCGPRVEAWNPRGVVLAVADEAIGLAADHIRHGEIVAVLGIGGFHLFADARDEEAVRSLRTRKRRSAKPLAVMCPSIAWADSLGTIAPAEKRLLASPEAPIVLVESAGGLADSVSGDLRTVGLMLPYSPLHHLLMRELGFPVVATSGNLAEEPICCDLQEGLVRFAGIADLLLVHNRPIVRPIDDSVVRVMAGRVVVFRRGRGYAPMPIELPGADRGVLGVGAHLKNSVAITLDGEAVVGQHVGDLDNRATRCRMETEASDLGKLYGTEYCQVAHDLHPDYASTRFAEASGMPTWGVQHHVAHAAACLTENGLEGPVLAVVWDGTGFGPDGTVWGGEFLWIEDELVRRVGSIRPFGLPGGDAAARQGRRSAMGLLVEAFGAVPDPWRGWYEAEFAPDERRLLEAMIREGCCPRTTSAGRLFDAFAALGAGIRESRFEGEAAMRFEALAGDAAPYPFEVRIDGNWTSLDWAPALSAVAQDDESTTVASRFHSGLANGIAAMAVDLCHRWGVHASICLTGGCFQNRRLLEGAVGNLESSGFAVFVDQRIPPGDGGIAYGQLCAAVRRLRLADCDGNPYA